MTKNIAIYSYTSYHIYRARAIKSAMYIGSEIIKSRNINRVDGILVLFYYVTNFAFRDICVKRGDMWRLYFGHQRIHSLRIKSMG